MRKPSKKFTDLDKLYNWIQGEFESAGKSTFGSNNAEFEVLCLYDSESDWETLIKRTGLNENFRDLIDRKIELNEPCAIGVIIHTKGGDDSPFMCYKFTDEHIVAFDGKLPVTYKAGQKDREQAETRNALAGFGNEALGKIAELDKQNVIFQYQSQIDNLKTRHENELYNKERDIRELHTKIDALEKENSELQKENDEFYATIEKYARQIESLQNSSAEDTKRLLIGLGKDIMASRGMQTAGLSGYLNAQQPQEEIPMESLPQAQIEAVQQIDEKVLAFAEWYNNLPDLTQAEMREIMRYVKRQNSLSHILLNYLRDLARQTKEKKMAQAQQVAQQTAPAPQPQNMFANNDVAESGENEDYDNEDEEDNNDNEEDNIYGTI